MASLTPSGWRFPEEANRDAMIDHSPNISMHIPGILRAHCGGSSRLAFAARDVRTALEHLEHRYPELYRDICEETGTVRRHLNVYINSDDTRFLRGLDSALAPGDVLTILPAVSGG